MTYGSPNLEVQVGGDHPAPLTQTDARRGRGEGGARGRGVETHQPLPPAPSSDHFTSPHTER